MTSKITNVIKHPKNSPHGRRSKSKVFFHFLIVSMFSLVISREGRGKQEQKK